MTAYEWRISDLSSNVCSSDLIYGSDAVGGVVNLVLRDDFDGAETRLRYGSVTDGSLRQYGESQLWGTAWDTGAVLFNFDYSRNEPLFARARPYATGQQQGTTYMSPCDARRTTFITCHQALTQDIAFTAVLYHTTRHDTSTNIQPYATP